MRGLVFGYKTTFGEAFELEAWADPFLYSGVDVPEHRRSPDAFMSNINEAMYKELGAKPKALDDSVYVWNCMTKDIKLKGPQYLAALLQTFFDNIPPDTKSSAMVIGEAVVGSRAASVFTAAGGIAVPGILTPQGKSLEAGDSVIFLCSLSEVAKSFTVPADSFEAKYFSK